MRLRVIILVLTVPMRNGNPPSQSLDDPVYEKVLTVPMRNGNIRYVNSGLPSGSRSYRTYEEWKRPKAPSFRVPTIVLTVPMRNGNEEPGFFVFVG